MARNSEKKNLVHTVYIGGGTPSHVPSEHIAELMQTIQTSFTIREGSEITIEANPGTLTARKLDDYIQSGINRISLGVQSANDNELAQMGRIHTFDEVIQNISLARKAGFENLSIDLIFGLPGQTMQSWLHSVSQAAALQVEHISIYSLTIEDGTPFGTWVGQGKMALPDDDFMADQFTAAREWLAENGYAHYEISNWRRKDAKNDYTSRHNCQYWLNEPYIGFGLGAHSNFEKQRIANTISLPDYLQAILKSLPGNHAYFPASVDVEPLDENEQMKETMMLGLRLIEKGISRERFYERFGEKMDEVFANEINELIQLGLIHWRNNERITLTERGILLGNQAFIKFV